MPLGSLIMAGLDDLHRDLAGLVIPPTGFLQTTGGLWDPRGSHGSLDDDRAARRSPD